MVAAMTESQTVPDYKGKYYLEVLADLHRMLQPKTYFEIGTHKGYSLRIAECRSIAVDPNFIITEPEIIGKKPFCLLFQSGSDDFFDQHKPRQLFGRQIDLAFLDGLHRCEYLIRDFANTEQNCAPNSIIALHDCLPIEVPMADRAGGRPPIEPHRAGAWTGDVWRTLLALRKWRPDLSIYALDAAPTGLVLITGLDPNSQLIKDNYRKIVDEMLSFDLDRIGLQNFHNMVEIKSTALIDTPEKLTRLFWL